MQIKLSELGMDVENHCNQDQSGIPTRVIEFNKGFNQRVTYDSKLVLDIDEEKFSDFIYKNMLCNERRSKLISEILLQNAKQFLSVKERE